MLSVKEAFADTNLHKARVAVEAALNGVGELLANEECVGLPNELDVLVRMMC